MSIKAIDWAWKQKLPPTQKYVLNAIANFSDDDGIAWPSNARIIDMTGLSERSVKGARAALRLAGLIEPVPGFSRQKIRLRLEKTISQGASAAPQSARPALSKGARPAPQGASAAPQSARPAPINKNRQLTTNNRQVPPIAPHPPSRPKSKPKQTFPDPPDWVDREAWFGWLEMRRRKGAPATDHALALTLKKLAAWRDDGHDVSEILNTSTERGWTGVFEPKPRGNVVQLRPQFEAPPARSSNPFDGFYERFVGEDPPPFVESSDEEKRILRAAGIIGGF